MKTSSKTTYPVAMIIGLPLLILGGCANETVKLTPESAMTVNEIIENNEEFNEQLQEIDNNITTVPDQEVIEVSKTDEVETVEIAIETPVEEEVVVSEKTPKPDEGIIGFAFDQADIDAQYGELLWQHAQYLKENKNFILHISGHTDSSGIRAYNEMLSLKRANQVANILIDFGVDKDRIKVTGNADDLPLAGAVHHREHRRVELDFEDQQLVSN